MFIFLSSLTKINSEVKLAQFSSVQNVLKHGFISERVRYTSSAVRLSVCRLSVTFVRLTQAIEIFGNISTPFGTLAIC